MFIPAIKDLTALRDAPFEASIAIVGVDLTAPSLARFALFYKPDSAAAIVELTGVGAVGLAEGISVSVATTDGVPTTTFTIRLNKSTINAHFPWPDNGLDAGEALELNYNFTLTKSGVNGGQETRWQQGRVLYQPKSGPLDGGAAANASTLQLADDNASVFEVAGVDLLAPLLTAAETARAGSQSAAILSGVHADRAELAETAAVVGSNMHSGTASGLAATATTPNKFFHVVGSGNVYATLYENVDGVAVPRRESPSKAMVDALRDDLPIVAASEFGIYPLAENDRATSQTALFQQALATITARVNKPTRLVLRNGFYNAIGVTGQDKVVITGQNYEKAVWYRRQAIIRPPQGANPGAIFSASDKFGFGLCGLQFEGSHASGFRAIDLHNSNGTVLSGNQFGEFGDQAIRTTGFTHTSVIEWNLAYNCLMQRTRSGYAAVAELSLIDCYLEHNQFGCSAQYEAPGNYGGSPYILLDGQGNKIGVKLYNDVPRLAATWLTGGGYNWCTENNNELSEIGRIDDSFQSNFLSERYEFNKAWGLLSREGGGMHTMSKFNGNSRAGERAYAQARIEALADGRRPRQFLGASFDNSSTVWNFATRVLCEFDDAVYDTFPINSDPTFYQVPTNNVVYPVRIKTSDPRIRANGVPAPGCTGTENGVRNTRLEGAVVGVIGASSNPGALPTGWAWTGAALAIQVVSIFTESGMDVIRLRFSGTPTPAFGILHMATWDQYAVPANAGEIWTASAFVRWHDGPTQPVARSLRVHEIAAGGGNALNAGGGGSITPRERFSPIDTCRFTHTRTIGHASARRVAPFLEFGFGGQSSVDFTYDIAMPMIERAKAASSPLQTMLTRSIVPKVHDKQSPASGATITVANRVEQLLLVNAGTLAALAVNLPVMTHGDVFTLTGVGAISALTLGLQHGTFAVAAPTTLAVGGRLAWRFDASDNKVYPA